MLSSEAKTLTGVLESCRERFGKKYTERLILTAVKETKTQKTKYVKQKKCMKQKNCPIFCFIHFFCFTYFVFCVFVSLTAVRISRSVYFFTSNVLLIQVYLRSGNSQRLVAVVFPVYKRGLEKLSRSSLRKGRQTRMTGKPKSKKNEL